MTEETGFAGEALKTPWWKWVAIGVVTAVVILAVALIPAVQSSPDPLDRTNEFRSPTTGFLLDYPDGWHQLTGKELDRFAGFTFVARHEKLDAMLSVMVGKHSSGAGAGLEELGSKFETIVAPNFADFSKHSEDTVKIRSGEAALRYDYSAELKGGEAIRGETLIVPEGERIYFVSAWAKEADYRRLKSDIDQALATFRLY